MILVGIQGFMLCDEPGCGAQQPAHLFLTASGGMCFKPSTESTQWQVLIARDGAGPLLARCPLHKKEQPVIQPATLIPDARRNH